MSDTKLLDGEYILPTYARFPLEIVSGKGSLAYDQEGRSYIDLGAGIAVNTFGYADDEWVKAVTDQLNTLQHTSNLYYTAPMAKLAEQLCQRTGMKKVFFSNSGAEANECAIKAARRYAALKGKNTSRIITLKNSFHGRTLTTLAATGQDVFHKDFLPLTEGFESVEPTVEALTQALQKPAAAVIFEPVQGEGGVVPLSQEFVDHLAALAKEKDVLLIADEVQTGNGRCGTLYAYMQYGILPDILSTAKGLAGGLPLGATMMGEKLEGVFAPGLHGSTFGGNPVCAAAALHVLERLDDTLLQNVREKSKYIFDALTGCPGVKCVSGLGLMIGIEVEGEAKKLAQACLDQGVLVLTAKQKLRLLPPLNIPMPLLEKAIGILKEVLAKGA